MSMRKYAASGQNVITLQANFWQAGPSLKGEGFEGITVDASPTVGPFLEVRLGRLMLGSSIYFGRHDWHFNETSETMSMRRNDFHFRLGYGFSPQVYAFAAVKWLRFYGTAPELTLYDEFDTPFTGEYQLDYGGTLAGGGLTAMMNFPDSPIFLHWMAMYLGGTVNMKTTVTEPGFASVETNDKIQDGITEIEIALGYRLESGLRFMAGYRAAFSGQVRGEESVQGIFASVGFSAGE